MSINAPIASLSSTFGESCSMDAGVTLSLVSCVISLVALVLIIRGGIK